MKINHSLKIGSDLSRSICHSLYLNSVLHFISNNIFPSLVGDYRSEKSFNPFFKFINHSLTVTFYENDKQDSVQEVMKCIDTKNSVIADKPQWFQSFKMCLQHCMRRILYFFQSLLSHLHVLGFNVASQKSSTQPFSYHSSSPTTNEWIKDNISQPGG